MLRPCNAGRPVQETYECRPHYMWTPVCHCHKNGGADRLETVRSQQDHEVRRLRRIELVVEYAAEPRRPSNGRFVNQGKFTKMGGPAKAAQYGVFLLDNNLKSLLQSSAAAACLFKLVRGSMADVSSSDMQQFLDDYVHELDGDFTFYKMREACGLPTPHHHRPS